MLGHVDWVELYNPTALLINLEGYFLTDNLTEPGKWVFPETNIWPNDYRILTFGGDLSLPNSVNFSLPLAGGSLYLSNPAGEVIDSMHYPKLLRDDSYGLIGEKYYYFDTPTAESSNEISTGYKGYGSSPEIPRQSGAYPVGTNIVCRPKAEEETLYYSINGQTVAESVVYNTPLVLSKTTTIKAFSSADSLINSVPVFRTYFVNENHFLPVVHLTFDSLEMYDQTDGIYMLGPDASPDFPYAGANFWKKIEIDAHFAYFDSNLVFIEALQCGLKIHGGAGSRPYPMKSFQVRAKNAYTTSQFNVKYFKNKSVNKFKRLILRNSGNDYCKTCMLDGVLQNYFLDNNLDIDLMGYSPTVLYINGRYQGIQNLREKSDRYYISSNYDVNPDDINLLKHKELIQIDGKSLTFETLKDYTVENDLQNPNHFSWVEEQMDLESLVDYFSIEFFINNRDWPNNNIKVWNAPGHKWRYLCYDLDVGLRYNWHPSGSKNTLFDITTDFYEVNPHITIFVELLKNKEFKRYFINRYSDLINTIFRANSFYQVLEEGLQNLTSEMPQHFERWCGPYQNWEDNIHGLKDFIDNRPDIVLEDISNTFDLPNRSALKLDNYPTHGGTIKLNTILLEKFPFYGTYFETNTIDITAIPNPGQIFNHWVNLRNGIVWYSETLIIDPKQGDEFVAVYESERKLYHLSVAPNPVNDFLNLSFSLPESSPIIIDIIDMTGKQMLHLEDPTVLSKGTQRASLEIKNLFPGIYLLYLTTDKGRETIRVYKN